jgi:hypothetical protein
MDFTRATLKDAIRSFMDGANTPFSEESRLEQIMDRIDMYTESARAITDKTSLASAPSVVAVVMRADIQKEINRLIKDEDNFCGDNYGSEAADNGEYEVYFSQHSTEETLKKFARWLLGNEAMRHNVSGR